MQALEVQESMRAGAHAETGTNTTSAVCSCINCVLNIIDITSDQHNNFAIAADADEFIAADADKFIVARLGQLV